MRKIFFSLLIALMLLCIIPKNNVTQAKENATLTVSSTITKNDKAVIDIDLSGNSGIWALKFKVGYNHSALTLESVQNGEVFSDGDLTMPDKLDKEEFVFVASSNSLKDVKSNGTVATFNFKTVDYSPEGKYPIELTLIQAIDVDGNIIKMDTQDGTVTVSYDVKNDDIVFDKAKNEEITIPLEAKKTVNKVKINETEISEDSYTVDSDGNVVIGSDYLNTLKNGKYKVKVETEKKNYAADIFVKEDVKKEIEEKSKEAKEENKKGEESKSTKKINGKDSKSKKGVNKTKNGRTGQKSNTAIGISIIGVMIIAGIVCVLVKKRRVNG